MIFKKLAKLIYYSFIILCLCDITVSGNFISFIVCFIVQGVLFYHFIEIKKEDPLKIAMNQSLKNSKSYQVGGNLIINKRGNI